MDGCHDDRGAEGGFGNAGNGDCYQAGMWQLSIPESYDFEIYEYSDDGDGNPVEEVIGIGHYQKWYADYSDAEPPMSSQGGLPTDADRDGAGLVVIGAALGTNYTGTYTDVKNSVVSAYTSATVTGEGWSYSTSHGMSSGFQDFDPGLDPAPWTPSNTFVEYYWEEYNEGHVPTNPPPAPPPGTPGSPNWTAPQYPVRMFLAPWLYANASTFTLKETAGAAGSWNLIVKVGLYANPAAVYGPPLPTEPIQTGAVLLNYDSASGGVTKIQPLGDLPAGMSLTGDGKSIQFRPGANTALAVMGLLPVEVVEVSPKTKDEEGNEIAGSEKHSGKPLIFVR